MYQKGVYGYHHPLICAGVASYPVLESLEYWLVTIGSSGLAPLKAPNQTLGEPSSSFGGFGGF